MGQELLKLQVPQRKNAEHGPSSWPTYWIPTFCHLSDCTSSMVGNPYQREGPITRYSINRI